MADNEFSTPTVYRLKAEAPKAGISINDLYSNYETARRHYENWKYDTRVMESHGHVSLVEMKAGPFASVPFKFEVTRDLGEHKW